MLTDMVGRAAAVADLRALLDEHRLLTLTGPGGVGKTRLALETATQAADAFPDGAWLAELAGLAGTRTPANAVMAVLGIRDDSSVDPADLLAEALRTSRMLLILDNCEHLVDQVAKLAAQLLQVAPELRILVTSREPLMVAGEYVWAVPALTQSSAVQLFAMRPARPRRVSASMRVTPRLSPGCAGGSTGFRWRWNWRRPASGPWACTSSSRGSTTGSGCWSPAPATPRRGSRPCGPSSTGAGSCSPTRNGWCCGGWR